MTQRFGGKWAVLSLAMAATLAVPLGASARGWGGNGHRGDYRGAYYGNSHGGYGHGGYDRGGGHWSGGRWIVGAIVAGAVIGLINDVARPAPVYYGPGYYNPPVVYSRPGTVVYDNYGPPVVERRVVTRTVVYDDGYPTRYVRDDGYDN